MIAASRTVLVIGPAWSSDEAKATMPQREHAAIGRLEPGDAGEGGGLADRAAGVGAGGGKAEVGGHGGGRAARGAARRQLRASLPRRQGLTALP